MSNPNGVGGFIKGKSGNPHGRPKRAIEEKYLKAFFSQISSSEFKDVIGALVKSAKRGDARAAKILMDYCMGVPVQKTELSGPDGSNIVVKLVDDKKR